MTLAPQDLSARILAVELGEERLVRISRQFTCRQKATARYFSTCGSSGTLIASNVLPP
jgi:hypothetical protein